MKTLRFLSIAVLVALAALTSRGGDGYLLYDLTTKQVSAPLIFWRSNLLAGAEITWTYIGNLPSPVLADSVTRDSELAAAISALSGTYQPLNTNLSDLADGSLTGSKVGSGISADNITTGTVADARIAATIARLASPALTGTPTVNGTNFMALIASGGGGGGSGNADTNNSTAWADSTSVSLYDLAIRGTATIANLSIGSASYSGVWGFANGGHGATTAAGARTALGLEKDVDVQTFRLPLLQFHVALAADGDMPYRNASGIVTNATSTAAGRTLLTAANAAAQRSSMGVPALAGDTFTGDINVPDEAYGSGWDGSTEVPTKNAVYDKIETVLAGGFISTVDTNFDVVGAQLRLTNTVGSGRVLRETAAGTNTALSGNTDVQMSGPVNTEYLRYNGSKWANAPWPSRMMESDDYEEAFTSFSGGASQALPFTSANINSGSVTVTGNRWGRLGVAVLKSASGTTLWSGECYNTHISGCIITNRYWGHSEYLFAQTNGVNFHFGWSDAITSTNAPTVCLQVAVTNGVLRLQAACNSASVLGSSTHVVNTNFWYSFWIRGTNQTASVEARTNGVPAWQDTITATNIPAGTGLAMGFGAISFVNASAGAGTTNSADIGVLNNIGWRMSARPSP